MNGRGASPIQRVLRIAGDADHGQVADRALAAGAEVAVFQTRADRAPARPGDLGKSLVDDRDERGARSIAAVEESPSAQRDAQRRQVLGRDDVPVSGDVCLGLTGAFRPQSTESEAAAAERRHPGRGDLVDRRHRPKPFAKLLGDVQEPIRGVAAELEIDHGHLNAFDSHAGIDPRGALERANQQAGDGHQHETARELGTDEQLAHPLPAWCGVGGLDVAHEIRPRASPRRKHAGHEAGDQGDRRREGEHAPIDRELELNRHRHRCEQRRQQREHHPRQREGRQRAPGKEQEALGRQQRDQRASRGAKREAYGDLARPIRRPSQQQAGDIGARHQKHQADQAHEQREERRDEYPAESRKPARGKHREAHVPVVAVRMLRHELLHQQTRGLPRLIDRHVRAKPRAHDQPVRAS